MSLQLLATELRALLPVVLMGLAWSAWGAFCGFICYQVAYRRGLQASPQAHKDELRQARFERGVAEERLESQEQTIRTLRMALQQATESREGLRGLRVEGGRG